MREWLSDLRKEKEMTCAELGERIGRSESYVFRIESGESKARGLDITTLTAIAKATGTDPMTILQAEIDWLVAKKA